MHNASSNGLSDEYIEKMGLQIVGLDQTVKAEADARTTAATPRSRQARDPHGIVVTTPLVAHLVGSVCPVCNRVDSLDRGQYEISMVDMGYRRNPAGVVRRHSSFRANVPGRNHRHGPRSVWRGRRASNSRP